MRVGVGGVDRAPGPRPRRRVPPPPPAGSSRSTTSVREPPELPSPPRRPPEARAAPPRLHLPERAFARDALREGRSPLFEILVVVGHGAGERGGERERPRHPLDPASRAAAASPRGDAATVTVRCAGYSGPSAGASRDGASTRRTPRARGRSPAPRRARRRCHAAARSERRHQGVRVLTSCTCRAAPGAPDARGRSLTEKFQNPHAIFAGAPPGNTSGRSSKYRKPGGAAAPRTAAPRGR